ncbi:MAG TPA: L,D-transpeptidase family protein [Puia sp.]|nr:L,D-transpeptidase family protein [Puia sp.]
MMLDRSRANQFLMALPFIVMACQSGSPRQDKTVRDTLPSTTADTSFIGAFSEPSTYKFDSTALDSFFAAHRDLSPYAKDVRQFYQTRNYAFAWHDSAGQIEQASNLYNRIRRLPEDGVNGGIPYSSQLDTLMMGAEKNPRNVELQVELLLTSMYFYFAEKAWTGLPESQTKKMSWFLPRKKVSYQDWLQTYLSSTDSAAREKEPIYRQYFLLRDYLQKYTSIQQQEGWQPLFPDRKAYRSGDSGAVIKEIKRRLHVLGDLQAPDTTDKMDDPLISAVKKFQRRMGLSQDGVIGQSFTAALNIPLQKRIDQIIVNMERSRWLPDTVQGEYLAINIPEFKLHLFRDDSLLWDMNVVVGQALHKTVIFSGVLKNIVFSPYWNVPPGILKNEVLPGIKKDKNYLVRHHMEWYGNTVRQKPGPWNSLGGVKFLFPNSYNIYLHDTPAKNLFGESSRAFSHGCIRLAEPAKLAAWLLRNDPQWTMENISRAMHAGREKWINVAYPFRVFIIYFTAWVDREGNINFRKDIYDRDGRLAKSLTR